MSIAHALRFLGDTVVKHGAADPASDRTALGILVIDAVGVPMHALPTTSIDDLAAIACCYATRTAIRA